jgi:hypothetical protein
MVALCEEIDRNVHLFKTKPIGPLGRHIKLTQDANKNEGLNTLLEIQLGMKNLRSFLVACNEDRLALEKMMQKQWTARTRQPRITVRKRYGRVYDISSGRVPHSAGVKTMMDYLVFTNAEVINYFIDKKGIERVIVTDDLSAQRLFHSVQSVPR